MEEIGDVIGKGFGVWRSNLNLCTPFLLSIFVSVLVLIPFLIAFSLILMPLASMNLTSIQNMQDFEGLLSQIELFFNGLSQKEVFWILFLFLGLIILLSLVSAFFTAGAVSMARQAVETGRADTKAMWSGGKSHVFNMLLAFLIMALMTLAGLLFLLPGLIQLPMSLQTEPQAIGLILMGLLMFILYALAMSVLLAAAPYALVVEGLGPVQSISSSINFFRYNKFDVMILWLVVMSLSMVLQMAGNSFSIGESVSYQPLSVVTGLVNLLVLSPLSNIWWTRLYMNRKGMLKVDEVKDPW